MSFLDKKAEIIEVNNYAHIPHSNSLNIMSNWENDKQWSVVFKEGTVVNNRAIYVPNGFYVDTKDPRWSFMNSRKVRTKHFNSNIDKDSVGVLVNPVLFGLEEQPAGTDVTDFIGLDRFPKNHRSLYKTSREPIYPPVPRFQHPLPESYFRRFPEGDYVVVPQINYDVLRCGWHMGAFYVGCGKHFYETDENNYYWYHAIKNRFHKVTESLNDGEFLYVLLERETKIPYIWDLYMVRENRYYDYAALLNLFDIQYYLNNLVTTTAHAPNIKNMKGTLDEFKESQVPEGGSYILRRTHESVSKEFRPILTFRT